MKVYLVGVGMGNPDTLTIQAQRAIAESDLIIGAQRLLEGIDTGDKRALALTRSDDIVRVLAGSSASAASVLLSGDVGFYSGASLLYEKLADEDVEAISGVSSVGYLCAKLKTTWQDACLVSMHGRDGNVVGKVQTNAKTVVLTGGTTRAEDVCRLLVEAGLADVRVAAGERLSYADERIVEGTARELASESFADLTVLLVSNDRPIERPFAAPSLTDDAFTRSLAPMTKEEVRELSVAKMRIRRSDTVWDVGAGTGSVSVECALAASEGRVYAIEKNREALATLEQNKKRYGLSNLHVVAGEAPEAFEGIPAPDRVFIGGTCGRLEEIVADVLQVNPAARVVVTAVTVETVSRLRACLDRFAFDDVDFIQVSVTRIKLVGSSHMMRALNPVFIASATGRGGE